MLACLSTLICIPMTAQDATSYDDDEYVTLKKKVVSKLPQYPTVQVMGKVIDGATRQPLAGIQIKTLGDNRYTAMTDDNGLFTIKVPTFATSLFVHAPGFLSQQVPVGKINELLEIVMLSDNFKAMYDDGTEVQAKSALTIHNTTSQTIETDIQGSLGADIRSISRSGGPGYGNAMFIRGISSLNASAQPLIVIDGVVREMQTNRNTLHYGDFTNLMLNINPEEVEKVEVIKNGTALYGAKAAGGVIEITTKRGHSLATRIDANVGVGFELIPRQPDMMEADQYRIYASELLGTHPDWRDFKGQLNFLIDDPSKYYYANYHNNTDWKDEVFHEAMTQNYNINVQGGDDIGMYNLSLGYTDAQSTARYNSYNRLNVRFNSDISILYQLSTRFDMSFAKINRNVFDNGAPEDFSAAPVSSPTLLALIKAPILNPYNYNSVTHKLSDRLADADDFLTDLDRNLTLANPTALLRNGKGVNKNRVETTFFNTTIAPRWEFNRYLDLTSTFSYTLDRISQRYYRPVYGVPTYLIEGIGRVSNLAMSMASKQTSVVSDTRLSFARQFAAHNIKAYAGVRYSAFFFDDNEPKGQYAPPGGNDKQPNITASMDYISTSGVNDAWKSLDWYVNADYNYRNRYFAKATLTLESSSRFGSNSSWLKLGGVSWGIFPSLQLGWNVTNESWFPRNTAIDYLLLKAGYDISGNDDISNYAAKTSFTVSRYLYQATAAQLNNIGNDKISYERTGRLNLGLTSHLLKNRLSVDFDFYWNHTSDLLTLKTFENPVAGINNYWSNGGSLDNSGFELTVSAKPIAKRNVSLELGASMGHYKNEVKSLPNLEYITMGGEATAQGFVSSVYGTDNIATIVGQPVGLFYGYRTNGVIASEEDARVAGRDGYLYQLDATGVNHQNFTAGDMRFVDLNGDGMITPEGDRTIIGDPNPDIYGNIFAAFRWKDLTLSLGFNYSLGNDIYNYQRRVLESGMNFYNQTTAMENRWRFEGQHAQLPKATFDDPMGNARFSDRWIEDGSYLRLKTLNLTYRVPVPGSWEWLQGLSIWAEANNLFTLTKYIGSDPEMSVANGVLYQGIDAGNVALSRAFTMGLRINL